MRKKKRKVSFVFGTVQKGGHEVNLENDQHRLHRRGSEEVLKEGMTNHIEDLTKKRGA